MKDQPSIKTIFFDLGNVLIFFDHSKMLTQIASCTGISLERIRHLLIDQRLGNRYEAGEINNDEMYRILQAISTKRFTQKELYSAVSDIFTPNDSMYPLIKSLKQKGLRLVLLSNTSPAHFEFLSSSYSFFNNFDAKILSYEVGACKPNPRIYRAALQKANCLPQECFYTDDVPEFIAEAKVHGIDAEVFLNTETLKKDLSKRSLY